MQNTGLCPVFFCYSTVLNNGLPFESKSKLHIHKHNTNLDSQSTLCNKGLSKNRSNNEQGSKVK